MMIPQTFCIITPSYTPDFKRCRVLSQSIDRCLPSSTKHYIIVDKQDYSLFQALEKKNTKVITKESILPPWIWRIPFLKKEVWFSWKTPPIRGWIIQQMIKIAIAHHLQEDVLVYADSDMAFVRPFTIEDIVKNGQVRFYCKRNANSVNMKRHVKWHQRASDVLHLPAPVMPAPDFIDDVITWKRENVLRLCQYLEAKHSRSWIEVLLNQLDFSEYILYGVFVDQVLQNNSGHYFDDRDICSNYWAVNELSEAQVQEFLSQLQPQHLAVMISAKSGTPAERYDRLLQQFSDALIKVH